MTTLFYKFSYKSKKQTVQWENNLEIPKNTLLYKIRIHRLVLPEKKKCFHVLICIGRWKNALKTKGLPGAKTHYQCIALQK